MAMELKKMGGRKPAIQDIPLHWEKADTRIVLAGIVIFVFLAIISRI